MAWDYATEIAADSPYLWWRCRETAGTTAADASGNGRNGTYFGTDLTLAASRGIHSDETARMPYFNPSESTYDAGIIYNPVAAGFPSTDFTLEWVGREYSIGAGRTLWSYCDSGGVQPDTIRVVWSNTFGRVVVFVNGASVNLQVNTSWNKDNDNQLAHYAITWRNSDGRAQFWLNGVLQDEQNVSSGFSIPSGGGLVLCQDQDSLGGGFVAADALSVRAGEFAVYDSVLSEARIRAHASAATTRYVDLDELAGDLGTDVSADVRPFDIREDAAPITAPSIVNISPVAGTELESATAVTFEVLNATTRIIVVAYYPNLGFTELVHDGDGFAGPYSPGSTRTSIASGFRFLVRRDPVWIGPPSFTVYAFAGGLEL